MRTRGYNYLQDDNDRGIVSKDPVIILDPNGNIKRMGVRELSKREINQAQQMFSFEASLRGGG